jgi:hypothetical protein
MARLCRPMVDHAAMESARGSGSLRTCARPCASRLTRSAHPRRARWVASTGASSCLRAGWIAQAASSVVIVRSTLPGWNAARRGRGSDGEHRSCSRQRSSCSPSGWRGRCSRGPPAARSRALSRHGPPSFENAAQLPELIGVLLPISIGYVLLFSLLVLAGAAAAPASPESPTARYRVPNAFAVLALASVPALALSRAARRRADPSGRARRAVGALRRPPLTRSRSAGVAHGGNRRLACASISVTLRSAAAGARFAGRAASARQSLGA